jgi:hypothetical protein
MMFFMAWMTVVIFIPFFAPSLSILAFGEAMCGIPWGVFQVRHLTLISGRLPIDVDRRCRQHTLARLSPLCSGLTLRHMFVCAGVLEFFFPLVL